MQTADDRLDLSVAGSTGDLVVALVNTRAILADDPYAREDLGSPSALCTWWAQNAGTEWTTPPREGDVRSAIVIREGLRALLARNNDSAVPGDLEAIARLEAVAADLPMRVSVLLPSRPRLVPSALDSPAAAFADLLGRIAVLAQDERLWSRLKVCRDPHCREAFRDVTRSRTRTWCSMEVCGSRAKQRTFAERHRSRL